MSRPCSYALLAALAVALPNASAFHRKAVFTHSQTFSSSGVAMAPNLAFSTGQVAFAPTMAYGAGVAFVPTATFAPTMAYGAGVAFAPAGAAFGGCSGGTAAFNGSSQFGNPSASFGLSDIREIFNLINGLQNQPLLRDRSPVGTDVSRRLGTLEDKVDGLADDLTELTARVSKLDKKKKKKKTGSTDSGGAVLPEEMPRGTFPSSVPAIEASVAGGDPAGLAAALASSDRLLNAVEGRYYVLQAWLKRNPMDSRAAKIKEHLAELSKELESKGRKPTH